MIDLERKLGFERISVLSDATVQELVKVLTAEDCMLRL